MHDNTHGKSWAVRRLLLPVAGARSCRSCALLASRQADCELGEGGTFLAVMR